MREVLTVLAWVGLIVGMLFLPSILVVLAGIPRFSKTTSGTIGLAAMVGAIVLAMRYGIGVVTLWVWSALICGLVVVVVKGLLHRRKRETWRCGAAGETAHRDRHEERGR